MSRFLPSPTLRFISSPSGYYLTDYLELPLQSSLELMVWSEVGGLVGSLTCGWISDRFGQQPLTLCALSSLLCVVAINQLPSSSSEVSLGPLRAGLSLFVSGYCINVPKTLLSLGLRQLVPGELGGSVEGVFGLSGQLGASMSGVGVGMLVDTYGWGIYKFIFLSVALSSTVCLVSPTLHILRESSAKIKIA